MMTVLTEFFSLALTEEDIKTLDGGASSKFTFDGLSVRTVAGRVAVLALAGAAVIGLHAYLGLDAIWRISMFGKEFIEQ